VLDLQRSVEFRTVSKPSRPFALVPIAALCHAENCSMFAHVAQALEKPQVA